jgi:ketosteroid isomerase-like protein
MSGEESTTPELVDPTRKQAEAGNRHDLEAMLGFWAPDGIWGLSPMGLGVYGDRAAIRGFFEDWLGAYEELEFNLEEVLDLGNGVSFAMFMLTGRPDGTSAQVQMRYAGSAYGSRARWCWPPTTRT